jgi:hypothetical protein
MPHVPGLVAVFLVLAVPSYVTGAATVLTKNVEDTPTAPSVCPSFSHPAEPCTSVWNMKPSQVDAVLALGLGDSISADFGAKG